MMRLGVLASGQGTNLQAILDACDSGRLPARVVWVGSNRPLCPALKRAQARQIPTVGLDPDEFASRDAYERSLTQALRAIGPVDLTVLAGYLRIAGPTLLFAYPRMINLHPSLLPGLRGLGSIRRALAAGLRETGCTVHVVDAGLDTGPVLRQRTVPIQPDDTLAALENRMHAAEHELLIETLVDLAVGRLHPWTQDPGPIGSPSIESPSQ